MKFRLLITGIFTLLMTLNAWSSTLKLSTDIDLLVLDGRKISGSLLKGAEGLELEQGEHQFLFRIEKTLVHGHHGQKKKYVSVPLIATFTTQAKTITIRLPSLETLQDGQHFDTHPEFKLINENGQIIASRRDILRPFPERDVEQAMLSYNRTRQIASVPRFAKPPTLSQQQQKQNVTLVTSLKDDRSTLPLFIYQMDNATREQFARLKRALRTS